MKGGDEMRRKSQKKRSPDWQKLLAILISILIMIAQFEAVRLGAWSKDQTAVIMA
jgi:hypothetical protein